MAARASRAAWAWALRAVEGAWALTAVEGVVETSRHGHVLTCPSLAQSHSCIGEELQEHSVNINDAIISTAPSIADCRCSGEYASGSMVASSDKTSCLSRHKSFLSPLTQVQKSHHGVPHRFMSAYVLHYRGMSSDPESAHGRGGHTCPPAVDSCRVTAPHIHEHAMERVAVWVVHCDDEGHGHSRLILHQVRPHQLLMAVEGAFVQLWGGFAAAHGC